MTNPTLRELVDMLPGEMRDDIQLTIDCMRSIGGADWMLENAFLGYLVRWLGERGIGVMPERGRYIWIDTNPRYFEGHPIKGPRSIDTYPTPLEAAVRAVGGICGDGASTSRSPLEPQQTSRQDDGPGRVSAPRSP